MTVTVIIELDEKVLAHTLEEATKLKFNLNEYIKNVLSNTELKQIEPKIHLDLDSIINQAIQNGEKKVSGDEFNINDVCSDQIWEQLSNGERKRLGKLFRKEVESKRIALFVRRTSANKAIYKRL